MSAGDDKTLKVIIVKSKAAPLVIIDPFMVFSTFDMDMLGKIQLHDWEELLKVSTLQRAKKVMSNSPGLVDFAIGLVKSVFNLPNGQVMFFEEFE